MIGAGRPERGGTETFQLVNMELDRITGANLEFMATVVWRMIAGTVISTERLILKSCLTLAILCEGHHVRQSS